MLCDTDNFSGSQTVIMLNISDFIAFLLHIIHTATLTTYQVQQINWGSPMKTLRDCCNSIFTSVPMPKLLY